MLKSVHFYKTDLQVLIFAENLYIKWGGAVRAKFLSFFVRNILIGARRREIITSAKE